MAPEDAAAARSAGRAPDGVHIGRMLWLAAALALATLLAACVVVPPVQQAFAVGRDGALAAGPLPCPAGPSDNAGAVPIEALPDPLRVVSWNIYKNDTPGWERDLARFAAASDLLLLQEASLTPELRRGLSDAGFAALLASAFTLNGRETGVLNASRAPPASACAQRAVEPLLGLPKSALIARYRLQGLAQPLAVANVHSINFAPGVDEYRAQLQAIAGELAGHRGPVIVAGDLNTWSARRREVVDEVMRGLGLAMVELPNDTRSRVLGQQVDYLFVRGLEVVHAQAPQVATSDHNPVLATLRATAPGAPPPGRP